MRDVRFRFGLAASVLGFVTAISGTAAAQGAIEPPVEQQPAPPTPPTPAQPPAQTEGAASPVTAPPAVTGAATEPTPPVSVTPPPPVPSRGVEMHDGFYFRAGLGLGGLMGKLTDEEDEELSLSGFSVLSELAFGGTPVPGVVIGGGIYTGNVSTTTYEVDLDGGGSVSIDGSSSTVGLIAPFVDVYPNPEQGLHFGGAIGLGVVTADEGDDDDDFYFPPDKYSGVGLGLMAQAGYEAWVADQWSIGGVARLLFVRATLKPEDDDVEGMDVKASVFVPGVLFTATYH
jgi:hypothetical protein